MGGSPRRLLLHAISVALLLNLWSRDGSNPGPIAGAQAQQFGLIHKYARGRDEDSYHETLKAHDRRRLAAVLDFPLTGDDSVFITGLYYTQITMGTPPRNFHVQVDTGSDVTWLKCAPCIGCPLRTDIKGISLTQYDPTLSTTDAALSCGSADCATASNSPTGLSVCTNTQACEYSILYGDGSTTMGYMINDVLTFTQVANSTTSNGTANVYFGCGYNQTGNLVSESRAVDGLMGFGASSSSVPTQLANQKKTGRVFAHCLQGDNQGGGTMVIGNILEPNIVYTPILPRQSHYSINLLNIAVNGVNITTPTSFDAASGGGGGGAIMDSGTTLAYLVQDVYTEFVARISSNAPVAPRQYLDSNGETMTCFAYTGNIVQDFPKVSLYFDGGAVMNLGPKNYLLEEQIISGTSVHCIGWMPSLQAAGFSSYTIFGDIVLKDQLIVYDNDKQRIGWKPFDCTKPVSVSTPNSTDPMTVLPGSSGSDSPRPWSWFTDFFGSPGSRNTMSPYVLLYCLALAFLSTCLS